jgi:protein SCO1/2
VLIALASAVLAGCGEGSGGKKFLSVDVTGAPWGRGFELTDHTGKRRASADFRGKVALLFFGYTNCPDMCPTALAEMAATVQALGPDGARVQGLFVTLDPARDTPEVLAKYVPAFHPTFLGLRGDATETAAAAAEFKIFYAAQASNAAGYYTVDHTAGIYALDRAGRLRLFMGPGRTVEAMTHDIKVLLEE